jgi:uridine kinase
VLLGYIESSGIHIITAFKQSLLLPLMPNGSRKYRTSVFDYRTDSVIDSPSRQAKEDSILIVDGIFLLRPELIGYWNLTIFVDVKVEVGVARCALRDGTGSPDPNAESNRRYVQGQAIYFAECNPHRLANVVFDNNDLLKPLIRENQIAR